MDGDAIVHIRETADLYSKRSQFHNQHFKMAQAMLEHAHTLEKKLEAVELMIRSSKMARRDANRITMVFYGIQAAKTALELAPLAQDEIQIRKCLDLAFDAAGLISMDGISSYNRSFAN